MKFKVDIVGLKELRAKVAGIQKRLGHMQPGYKAAGNEVLRSAKNRINNKGPGWPPTIETEKGSTLQRTGALRRSLSMGSQGNVTRIDGDGISVGTNLKTNTGVSYPRILQEGSGIYGPTGARITPKNGRFLSFMVNGKRVFVKSVKGTPPRPFLYIDDEVASNVRTVIGRYIMKGGAEANDS